MRVVVFYVCLYLLMLCGGHALYARTHYSCTGYSSTQSFAKKQQVKVISTDHSNTTLDDADLDIDDDYVSGKDVEGGGANRFLSERYGLPNRWYLTFSLPLISNYYNKRFNAFPPFCGDSSPLYITQRVLRI